MVEKEQGNCNQNIYLESRVGGKQCTLNSSSWYASYSKGRESDDSLPWWEKLWSLSLVDLGSIPWDHCSSSFFFPHRSWVLVCGRVSFVPCLAQEMGTGDDALSRHFFGTHFILVFSGAWELFYVLAGNFYWPISPPQPMSYSRF